MRTLTSSRLLLSLPVGLLAVAALAKPSAELERKKLRVGAPRPFEKRQAQVRALGVASGGAFMSNVPIVAGHALVGSARSHWGSPTDWILVDLKSGQKQASVRTVREGSAATKTAVVALGDPAHPRPALLHLTDGKIVEPTALLPDGKKAAQVQIIVDQRRPVTWVVGKGSDGRVYEGAWADPRQATVKLENPLGFWPTRVSGKNGIQAWRDSPEGASGACDRVLLDPKEPARCRPLTGTNAPPFDLVDDCVRALEGGRLVDDCAGRPPERRCEGPARTLLLSADPVAALIGCADPRGARVTLWTPKQSYDLALGGSFAALQPELGPRTTVGLEALAKPGAAVTHWLDLAGRVLYEGPPLRQLNMSEHRDARRRLAQPVDKLNELWLVDLDAGTAERIADDIDCDAPLYEYARSGERATIECLPKSAEAAMYRDEQRLASWRWMEVVDLKARTRWRTTDVFEARIGEDGSVVGTKRGKPARIAVVETP